MENIISKADKRLMASPYYIQFKSAENMPVDNSDYGYVRNGTYRVEDEYEEVSTKKQCCDKQNVCTYGATAAKASKKNKASGGFIAAGVINLIMVVAFIAVLVLSYLKIVPEYTYFFNEYGIDEIIQLLTTAKISDLETAGLVVFYATNCTPLLAAALAVIDVILCIIGLATKGKVRAMGVISLIALISWLAMGILMFFAREIAQDSESIINYINPLVEDGVNYGFYISALLLLIATICGFCCGKKRK